MKRKKDKYSHYDELMDDNNLTGKLFGKIPFNFYFSRNSMAILMMIPLLLSYILFPLGPVGALIIFILTIIFNIEYNRVRSVRSKVIFDCIWNQLTFEDGIAKGRLQLSDAPNYIDQIDIDCIFKEAIRTHKKASYYYKFNKMLSNVKKYLRV